MLDDDKITENFCKFQIAFSQWRAGLIKKLFWDVFLWLASFVLMKNFRFISPALHVFFFKKCHIFYHIRGENIFLAKYLRFYTIQSHLNQKWPKTKQLLLKMFLTSNCSLWLHSAVRVNYLIWFDQIRMGWKGLDLATLYFINRFKNLNENPPTPLASSTVSMAVKGLGLVLPIPVTRVLLAPYRSSSVYPGLV